MKLMIGRTARGTRTGVAYTFFTDRDTAYLEPLVKLLEKSGQVRIAIILSDDDIMF
jgi:superfamily II DNA/RNA helicase